MVPVQIETIVSSGPTQAACVILRPIEESVGEVARIVPIWMGPVEAANIAMALDRTKLSRPMTHDLFLDAITNLDARVTRIILNNMKGKTFFAQLELSQGGRIITLDARPSDAIAVALRQDSPMFIRSSVLDKASFPYIVKDDKSEEAELEDFRSFIETIAPEDFEGDL